MTPCTNCEYSEIHSTMTKPRAEEIAVLITATLLILGSWVVFGLKWVEVFN